ncbi:hypothetical protein KSP40_PGU016403 [Platanthera guangdongensis]|uniref:Uncharacterized protein n=1 Tax=Platanthera guangdongensis TaxID=2320717 RepID=A0ABR2M1K2_9ASPA
MSGRPQVTITLGRSGQVVKRERIASDVSSSDYAQSMEGKPSIRERLGNSMDGQYLYESRHSKRYAQFFMLDFLGLTAKLKLTQLVLRSTNFVQFRGKEAHARANSALSRGIPPTRNADDLLRLDSSRKSYPSLTLDGLGHRSPDSLLGAPRHMSPKRNYDEVRQNPSVRLYDDSRPTVHVKRSIPETSRPSVFMSKTVVPVDSSKSVFGALPGAIQKIPYMPEEKLTVSGLLLSLGLGKYAINFQAEEVIYAVVFQCLQIIDADH